MNTKETKKNIILAGQKAVKELIKVAEEKIVDSEDDISADRLKNAYWSFDEVASKMEKNITQGFKDAYALSKKHKVDMRKATMVLAVERVLEAFNQKGIWP